MQARFVAVIYKWEGYYYADCPEASVFGVNEPSLERLEERLPQEIREKVLSDLMEGRAIRKPCQINVNGYDECFVKVFTFSIDLPDRPSPKL